MSKEGNTPHDSNQGTQSGVGFEESARELVTRLHGSESFAESREAQAFAQEAQELLENFLTWKTERPSDEKRLALIRQLFALQRHVMDYLAIVNRPREDSR